MIRALAEERTDPVLFGMSHDYVGDLAETIALIWPARATNAVPPTMTEVVQTLHRARPRPSCPSCWPDGSTRPIVSVRYALLKLITGSLAGRVPPRGWRRWRWQQVADGPGRGGRRWRRCGTA